MIIKKRNILRGLLLAIAVTVLTLVSLMFPGSVIGSVKPMLIPSPPSVSASSYILMDATTGQVIAEDNADKRLAPASLTKMMTAYIVEAELDRGNIDFTDEVPVSVKAWKTGGSRMFIQEGTTVKLEDLLKGIIIQSGNDASVAVAEYIAGGEAAFVDIMNQQAKLLGMDNTQFQSSTGLPRDNQYSTARDLGILAAHIAQDYPENYHLYAQKHFTYGNIRQPNRNKLLWRDDSVDGLKTGYTRDAGYCFVASAQRDGTRLVAVIMGASSPTSRANEAQKLLSYGFRYYSTTPLISPEESFPGDPAEVWKGQQDTLQLTVAEPVLMTLPNGTKIEDYDIQLNEYLEAPIAAGDIVGIMSINYTGGSIKTNVVAAESIEEAGFFGRLFDAIAMFFSKIFS